MKDTILRILFLLILAALLTWQVLITFGVIKPSHFQSKKPNSQPPQTTSTDSDSSHFVIGDNSLDAQVDKEVSTHPATNQSPAKPSQTLTSTIPKTKLTYIIDDQKCNSCLLCTKVCPVGAISTKEGKAFIDQSVCIRCGICKEGDSKDYEGCPVDAITVK